MTASTVVINTLVMISVLRTVASFSHNDTGVQGKRDLYRELLENLYSSNLSPLLPPNKDHPLEPVNIRMVMTLNSLLRLDMRTETLVVNIIWQDKSRAWNTSTYPYNLLVIDWWCLWRPVIAISNSLMSRDQIMKSEVPLELFSDGTVIWWPGDTIEVHCKVDIRYYPFDIQTCTVSIRQWVGSTEDANCTKASLELEDEGNGQWDIVDKETKVSTEHRGEHGVYWSVDFKLTLKRKPTFYIMNVFFPVFLVSGLNCLVFLLPVECGEKMSVSVTVFLTLAVFMTIIEDHLPDSSDNVCCMAVYLMTQMIFGALAVVLSALQVECHHVEVVEGCREPDIPMWTRPERSLKFAYTGRYSSGAVKSSNVNPKAKKDTAGISTGTGQEESSEAIQRTRIGTRTRTVFRHCRRIMSQIDVVCFPLFFVLNVISLVCLIIVVTHGPASKYS